MSMSSQGSSRPRIHVLDFIRLIAMLLMIQGHTLDAFVNPQYFDLDTFHWATWVHLRGLTAPLFLMVSGAASVLGIRHEADGSVSRALLRKRVMMALLVTTIGYLMVFPANRVADLPWVPRDVWSRFFQVNILQLNGVTLLMLTGLLAWTRTVKKYAQWSLGIGFGFLLLAPFVYAVDWFRWLPEGLAAYLSFTHGSLFPLFPASGYMFLGVGLGALLVNAPEEKRVRYFRLASLTASAALMLLALAVDRIPMDLLPTHDIHKAGHAYTLLRIAFALLVFGVFAWIAELRPRLAETWAPMGRKSLYVYVIHLVLIYGTPWTPGFATARVHAMGLGDGALFIPVIGGLTFSSILAWDWIRSHSATTRTFAHASAYCLLAYALMF